MQIDPTFGEHRARNLQSLQNYMNVAGELTTTKVIGRWKDASG